MILVLILVKIWDGLFIPWWFNTDELVIFQEVVRQLCLDPRQTFFDIPGTPYMSLASLVTLCWWAAERLIGLTTAATPSDFAFENIQQVHILMRSITFGCYLTAVGFGYTIFRRTSGVIVAMVGAILMCTLPIHVQYSYFVRTESLGLVLCLAAILAVLHPRTKGKWPTYLVAGALAGAAMGARFHFALVGLPVLLAIYFLRDRTTLSEEQLRAFPSKQLWIAGAILGVFFVAGGTVALLHKEGAILPGYLTNIMLLTTPAGPEEYPGAKQTIAQLWIFLGFTCLATLVLRGFDVGRRVLDPVLNPVTLALLLGFAGGFLFSHPTFLWRGEHQLRSIQFYSDWTDANLEAVGPFQRWWNVTLYYFTAALPEPWLRVLFVVGALLVLFRREPVPLAFLIGAVICFTAHPLKMKLWPHHIIPWLPFLCFIAAYPVGLAVETSTRRLHRPSISLGILLAVIVALGVGVSSRLSKANDYAKFSRARTNQIQEMNRWIADHVPKDSYVAVAYYAFNSDGFLKLLEHAGVNVPSFIKGSREVDVWWLLRRSTLDGKKGYVCVSKADIAVFRDDEERKNPGSTYDPFEAKPFKKVAEFGGGYAELGVFEFDLRHPAMP